MDYTINKLKKHLNESVELKGWVYNIRSIGKVWFMILRDGSGFIQCVVSKQDVDESIFSLEDSLTQESSVIVHGVVQEDKRSEIGVEILVKNIEVIQIAEEYPISLKEHGTSFLMDNRHLWLRSKKTICSIKNSPLSY